MTGEELLSDWRFWATTMLAIIFGFLNIILGRWGRKMQKLNLIPDCTLKLETFAIEELRKPGKKEGIGKFVLSNNVYIYRHGGIIKYPKFHHILTTKNPDIINYATSEIIQVTPMLDGSKCGPWDITIPIEEEQLIEIQNIYLALECTDREENDYFTIAEFEFILQKWKYKKSVYRTKRKRIWNKNKIELFYINPRKWLEKYGKKGKIISDL